MQAFVVGGYVRDHYLRRPSTDIDVVVVGSGIALAEALARELKAKVSVFKTFGTAMLKAFATPMVNAAIDLRADFLLTHEPDGLENGLVKVTNVPGMFEWLCENRDLDYTQIEI